MGYGETSYLNVNLQALPPLLLHLRHPVGDSLGGEIWDLAHLLYLGQNVALLSDQVTAHLLLGATGRQSPVAPWARGSALGIHAPHHAGKTLAPATPWHEDPSPLTHSSTEPPQELQRSLLSPAPAGVAVCPNLSNITPQLLG